MYQRIFSTGMKTLFLGLAMASLLVACDQGGTDDTDTEDTAMEAEAGAADELPPLDSIEAATDISDAEIETFLDAVEGVQAVSQQAQRQMMEFVQNEGLSLERFSEIQQKLQMPEAEVAAITAEEEEKLDRIEMKIRELEPELERKSAAAVREAGLTPLRYQELSKGIQLDQELSQKAQSMMQQRMMQQLQEAASASQGAEAPGN